MIAKTLLIGFLLTIAALELWKIADKTPSWGWEIGMAGLIIYWLWSKL